MYILVHACVNVCNIIVYCVVWPMVICVRPCLCVYVRVCMCVCVCMI